MLDLGKLEFLQVSDIKLETMAEGALALTPSLIHVKMSHNKLKKLPATLFYACRGALRRVSLDHNELAGRSQHCWRLCTLPFVMAIFLALQPPRSCRGPL